MKRPRLVKIVGKVAIWDGQTIESETLFFIPGVKSKLGGSRSDNSDTRKDRRGPQSTPQESGRLFEQMCFENPDVAALLVNYGYPKLARRKRGNQRTSVNLRNVLVVIPNSRKLR